MASGAVIEKAAGLVHRGRVHPAGVAAIYHVGGEHGIHRVIVGDGFTSCDCRATTMCSHRLAAMLAHDEAVDRVAAA